MGRILKMILKRYNSNDENNQESEPVNNENTNEENVQLPDTASEPMEDQT